MNGKKKRAEKKAKPKAAERVLFRFFKGTRAKAPMASPRDMADQPPRPSHSHPWSVPSRRSNTWRSLVSPIRNDSPSLLSRLLGQEKEKQRLAQDDFDRMVWDIVHKDDETSDTDESAENN